MCGFVLHYYPGGNARTTIADRRDLASAKRRTQINGWNGKEAEEEMFSCVSRDR